MAYITAYEKSRQWLHDNSIESTQVKSFISGGCASIASQTFVVPIDIVTQHLMILGRRKNIEKPQSHAGKPASSHLNPLNLEMNAMSQSRYA